VGYNVSDIILGVETKLIGWNSIAGAEYDIVNAATMPTQIDDGYFRNKHPGDVDGDKYVGSADFSRLAGAYGVIIGDSAYDREVDFDLDGYIGSADFSALAGNYGKTFP
jgi:hypothetical protein